MGIIEAKAPCTILLVGETGVGKSSIVEFIANALLGNDIDECKFDVLNPTNEQGGSGHRSQTKSVHLYRFTSKSGIVVSARIFEFGHQAYLSPPGPHPRHTGICKHSRYSERRAP